MVDKAAQMFDAGEACGVETNRNRAVAVRLGDGTRIAASQVVNATGAWSSLIASSMGEKLPVKARRRTVFVVSCPTALSNFPILVDVSGVYIRPEQRHYLCIVSPSPADDHDDLPLDPDLALFDGFVWPMLAQRVPAFEELRIERAWAGYYELNVADHNGLVGQWGADNCFVATGFSGHGLMHSPGVGRGLAELLVHGDYQSLDLSELSPRRLTRDCKVVEDAVY